MKVPYTISDDGRRWSLHAAGVDPIQINVISGSDQIDISADDIIWKVEGGPTVTLATDPDNDKGKLLVIEVEDIAAIPPRGSIFYVKNLTTDTVLLEGEVAVRGFA
jgi:hypothetical protein